MMLSDTSPGEREVYFRRLAEMTPSERVAIGAALWAAEEAFAPVRSALERAGIRSIALPLSIEQGSADPVRSS